VPWSVCAHCDRRPRQGGQAFGDQHGQIEHAQADRYREQPGVQLAGDPVEADQMMLHPETSRSSFGCQQHTHRMLRCNIKTGKQLLNFAENAFAAQGCGSEGEWEGYDPP
jgi:hypothetical protein